MDLFTAKQSREIDALLIEQTPIAGYELMCRAGQACFEALSRRWPNIRAVALFCGTGNNGGDGYVLARLLSERGYEVQLHEISGGARKGDALRARQDYRAGGGVIAPADQWPESADLLVDALVGTGLSRPLDEPVSRWIAKLNADRRPVLAIDIPSGLDADTGVMLPVAVHADLTVTFITRKRGMYTASGRDCCGELLFRGLGTDPAMFAAVEPAARLVDLRQLQSCLPSRSQNTHKGDFGCVLVVGGGRGMAGAVRLAGEAALRSGAGRVVVATNRENRAIVASGCPELMVYTIEDRDELDRLMARADVVVAGPGLGQGDWSQALLSEVLETSLPKVIDADALNLLARKPVALRDWILTPHPGEAARLLGVSTADVGADRFAAAEGIASRYGGVCVLKGCGSLVSADGVTSVCAGGNPGMATAGMGDVLAGVIAALLAQGLSLRGAAELGVCVHAAAGDHAAGSSPRGLLARDLMAHIRQCVNP